MKQTTPQFVLRRTPPIGAGRLVGRKRGRRWRRRREETVAEVSEPSESGRDQKLTRLEAVLFLTRTPLNSRKLSQYASLADGTEARTLIRRLNAEYDQFGRSFRVEEVGGGFLLMTRPKFADWLRRLEHTPDEIRLSAPALETLAVVAYRQPTLRADIEAVRGVNCGEILRQLMERDLVRISGRSDELGRPYLYSTTRLFLQTFGLRSLDDLPSVESFELAAEPSNPEISPEEVAMPTLAPIATEELEELKTTAEPAAFDDDLDDDDYDDDLDDDLDDDDLDDDIDDDDYDDDDLDDDDDDDEEEDEDDDWEEVSDDDDDDDDDWDEDDEEDVEDDEDWSEEE